MPDDVPGYRVMEQVGQGGFSAVYRARQERLDRIVALKVLNAGAVDDAAMRRFTRECRITGRLTGHPHVVTVLDTGVTRSGTPFIAMEYFEHGSLTDRLEREGPLPVPDVLRVGVKIASALAAVHEAGVLHRDVKPQNVLISRYGEPALTDFGIALLTESLDATHTTAFTPQHAAPEVLNGKTLRPTSDVYALGSTMYQLLAGGPAFHTDPGAGLAPLILRIVSEPPPPIQRPDLPDGVFDAVCQAMAKDPDDRFPTAISFATHLRRLQLQLGFPVTELPLAGGSAVSPPPVPGSRPRPAVAPEPEPYTGPQPSGSEDPTSPGNRLPGDPPPQRLSFPPPGSDAPPTTVPGPAAPPPSPGRAQADQAQSGPPEQAQSGPPAQAAPPAPAASAPGGVQGGAPGVAPGENTRGVFEPMVPWTPEAGAFADRPVSSGEALGAFGPAPGVGGTGPQGARGGPEQGGTGPQIAPGGNGGPYPPLPAVPGTPPGGPAPAVPVETSPPRKSRKGMLLATSLAVVATGVAVGLAALLVSQDDDPVAGPPPKRQTPAASPRPTTTDQPVTAAQIKLARPRAVRVKVVNHGRGVVLHWRLSRAARKIPVFVHKAPGDRSPVALKNGARTTTIGHLKPKVGYCFQVFTMVEPGNPPTLAKARPKCIRGAVAR